MPVLLDESRRWLKYAQQQGLNSKTGEWRKPSCYHSAARCGLRLYSVRLNPGEWKHDSNFSVFEAQNVKIRVCGGWGGEGNIQNNLMEEPR